MEKIALIDWIICAAYLFLIIGLGVYFSNKQKGNDDFFLGGKNMHWMPVGLSLFATTFSSNSFVGLPAEGAYRDYHQLLAIFFIPFVVIPITCYWFIPFYKSLPFDSLYEYLERRFNRSVRLLASIIFMIYSAGWMGTMLLAVSRILNVVLDTDGELIERQLLAVQAAAGAPAAIAQELSAIENELRSQTIFIIVITGILATAYTAMGGVKAVIWTDTVQAFALGGGMIFLFTLLLGQIDGGWETFLNVGTGNNKFSMSRTDGGLAERNIFSACVYGFFVYMGGQLASYGAFQRYITVDSVRDARRALAIKGTFTFVVCTLFFLVGTALFVFYQQSHADVFAGLSHGKLKDQLLPHFVVNFAGGYGMVGLLLAGLFAAAMSSLDSGINSMSASLVTDWFRGKEFGTKVNRLLTFFLGILVTGFACLLSLIDHPVFEILISIAGATLGLLLGVLMMGMLLKRVNATGVIFGMVAGLATFFLIRFWIPALSDEALLKIGAFAGLKNNTWWDGVFTTMPAILVAITVSAFTAPPRPEQLQGLLLSSQKSR